MKLEINRHIAISETGLVLNPSTGDSFATNPIGLEILQILKRKTDYQEIQNYIIQNTMLKLRYSRRISRILLYVSGTTRLLKTHRMYCNAFLSCVCSVQLGGYFSVRFSLAHRTFTSLICSAKKTTHIHANMRESELVSTW